MKRIFALALLLAFAFTFIGCDIMLGTTDETIGGAPYYSDITPAASPDSSTFRENSFEKTATEATSTFSADVDTASYTYFRKLVQNGYPYNYVMDNAHAFRTEEFLNYFRYEANAPKDGELFGVKAMIAQSPWNERTKLLRLTLQADDAVETTGNNLVFLIDVSGSMVSADKLPLLKTTFSYLTDQLDAGDRVSIVTYASGEKVVLTGCPGNQKQRILDALDSLTANGSTYGEKGLEKAYSIAADYYIEGGNNRIIMASDGDLNVGISSVEELKRFVEGKRDQGICLSVLGFGTGNYRDAQMETLADCGNGMYYYIDSASEAEKVFSTDLLSMLYTVAKDVKLQLTFDPEYVEQYRLIGYENRALDNDDFTDDTKDAGEVGAGHQVTVLYELVLTEKAAQSVTDDEKWITLNIRYKPVGAVASVCDTYAIGAADVGEADDDFLFMTAVAATVMFLHRSNYLGNYTLPDVMTALNSLDLSQSRYRSEFRTLVQSLIASDPNLSAVASNQEQVQADASPNGGFFKSLIGIFDA